MPNIFIFLEADVLGGRLGERLFPRNSFIVISPGLNSTKSLKRKSIARVMFQAGILGLANLNFTMKIVPKMIWKIKQNLTAQILVIPAVFFNYARNVFIIGFLVVQSGSKSFFIKRIELLKLDLTKRR